MSKITLQHRRKYIKTSNQTYIIRHWKSNN